MTISFIFHLSFKYYTKGRVGIGKASHHDEEILKLHINQNATTHSSNNDIYSSANAGIDHKR